MKKYLKFFLFACLCFFLTNKYIVKADNIYIPWLQLHYRNSSNVTIKSVSCEDNSDWCYLTVNSSSGTIAMGSGGLVYNNGNYNLVSGHEYQVDVTVEGIFNSTNVSSIQFGNSSGYSSYIKPTEQSKTTSGNGVFYVSFKFTMPSNFSTDSFFVFFSVGNNYIQTFGLKRSFTITDLYDGTSVIIDQNTTIINQNDIIIDQNNQTNQELGDLNDNLTNSDTTNATNSAGNFFSGFETDTFGLTSIITAPLELIGSITSSSCSPLPLTIPYVDKPFNLPCMTTIYEEYFGEFLTIYQTITFGIVAYWVCVRIFNLVKDFKNPDHDEVEVLDL